MDLRATDAEFIERFEWFAGKEIFAKASQPLDDTTRYLVILAALIGCQSVEVYGLVLPEALKTGLTPIMAKEIIYQGTAYLGFGRVLPFLQITNEFFLAQGIALPLAEQHTTTIADRVEKGAAIQTAIFGEHMQDAWRKGGVNYLLAANCFGDYYTRTGLTLAQRELITFCFLAAQGGCELQLVAHATGNMHLGNDKNLLMAVILQCLPYIGYPKSLNAINCLNQAAEENA